MTPRSTSPTDGELVSRRGAIEPCADEGALTVEAIEAAYARALEAIDAAEQTIPELVAAASGDGSGVDVNDDADAVRSSGPPPDQRAAVAQVSVSRCSDDEDPALQPHQVIEAVLFVGGRPLTLKRMAGVLGEESLSGTVEQSIDRLNRQYRAEERPYEIRLVEGGYALMLRPEFERIRDRVYGRNPKEVRLSQEALEVLAFVAYRQPVRCGDIEDAGKTNARAVLSQLLRRQLVSLHRTGNGSSDVTYTTTPRFLELFGLRRLDELPLPEDLDLK